MSNSLETILELYEALNEYEYIPQNNKDYVRAVDLCALRMELDLPRNLIASMNKFDRKHFVIKFDELLKYKPFLGNSKKIDEDLMKLARIFPYQLQRGLLPIDGFTKHSTNAIHYDLLMYLQLGIKQEDEVCEIGTLNGYLAAIIGNNCKSVTSFNLYPELHGLPDKNLELAKYDKNNIKIINDACPYGNTLHCSRFLKKFDKIYSNFAMREHQYEAAKRMLKPDGILITKVKIGSKYPLMRYRYDDDSLAVFTYPFLTLGDELNFN